jgi:hypothetical protein
VNIHANGLTSAPGHLSQLLGVGLGNEMGPDRVAEVVRHTEGHNTMKDAKKAQPSRTMKKIVVRRTAPIKVTSAPLNHQPITH